MRTIEVFISGRVQKVGFRACIRRIATDLNITGTVMNLNDGRVHVYASGDAIILEKFISMIYGCPRAVIRDIQIEDLPLKQFESFSIIKGDGRISTVL